MQEILERLGAANAAATGRFLNEFEDRWRLGIEEGFLGHWEGVINSEETSRASFLRGWLNCWNRWHLGRGRFVRLVGFMIESSQNLISDNVERGQHSVQLTLGDRFDRRGETLTEPMQQIDIEDRGRRLSGNLPPIELELLVPVDGTWVERHTFDDDVLDRLNRQPVPGDPRKLFAQFIDRLTKHVQLRCEPVDRLCQRVGHGDGRRRGSSVLRHCRHTMPETSVRTNSIRSRFNFVPGLANVMASLELTHFGL